MNVITSKTLPVEEPLWNATLSDSKSDKINISSMPVAEISFPFFSEGK